MLGKKSRIGLVLITLIITCSSLAWAGLEVDGTIKAEVIHDPLNFNPALARTDPWRSEDQGGAITPGYYVGHFTKLGLALKLNDERVNAYLPFTLGAAPFPQAAPSWQVYLLADDYLTIPYYLNMYSDKFVFSLSNRKVGDEEFGFLSMEDQLGVMQRPNSEHPMATLRIDVNLPGAWEGSGYVVFDQKVVGVPLWESLPQEIARLPLGERKLSEYGFTDEAAIYNFAQARQKSPNGSRLNIFWGQKYVDNPVFRLSGADENETGTILQNWGYLKQNLGVDFKKVYSAKANISGALVGSEVKWRKYSGADYTIADTLQGNAGLLAAELGIKGRKLTLSAFAVDPDFQAVAAVNGQFSVINRLLPKSADDPRVQRNVHSVFDPRGIFFEGRIATSPIVDYLGKRVLDITLESAGQINDLPFTITYRGQEVAGIGEKKTGYSDPLTGAATVKDYRELSVALNSAKGSQLFHMVCANRQYLGDRDYKRRIATEYEYPLAKAVSFVSRLEGSWRLRQDSRSGEGSALQALATLKEDLKETSWDLSADYRAGTYDSDLLWPVGDRIVAPYTYLNLRAFGKRKLTFNFAGGTGQAILAGELISQRSDLENIGSGKSIIGFVGLSAPWCKQLASNLSYLSVKGDADRMLPTGYLATTLQHELTYKPFANDDLAFQLGYLWHKTSKNAYAALVSQLGPGKFSISYGQPPTFSRMCSDQSYTGALSLENAYAQGYYPTAVLRGLPWEDLDSNKLNALYKNRIRSTENTWINYIVLRYWLDF